MLLDIFRKRKTLRKVNGFKQIPAIEMQYFIKVTLRWFKYSTDSNGVTLYTEKSQAFITDLNLFLSFVFHNDWLQNYYCSHIKVFTPTFVAVINVLLPICCHIGSGMPNLRIFVEDIVALLGTLTTKWVRKLFCGRNYKLSNDQLKFATIIIKKQFFATFR